MGRISEETIQEIRNRTDIVEVVSGYLPLKRSGGNHLGLCPFHQEKSPSFNVNEPRQIFHCFGCGVGGNVFSFLMRMEGLSFPEAVKRLGERVGIEVEETPDSPAETQRRELNEQLLKINEAACAFYHRVLLDEPAGAPGRRYLRQRGYDGETVRSFRLGFAPGRWEALAEHLKSQGFSSQDLTDAGLVRAGQKGRGDYDLFRNRLLFPIYDLQERVVAFGGRVLDDSLPKYINSPETPVYHKGRSLYGLCQARDAMRHSREVLVVEGYFDLLALARAGFANVVATCGTALTADHARLLRRYVEKVVLVFDEDAAGRQASFRAMDALLPEGLVVRMISMPAGADPDSLLRDQGVGAFQAAVDASRSALEVLMEDRLAAADDGVEGRARAAEVILESLRRLPSELERDLYIKQLAARTGLAEDLLRGRGKIVAPNRISGVQVKQLRPSGPVSPDGRIQRYLLKLMLASHDVCQRVKEEGTSSLFLDEGYRLAGEHLLESQLPDGSFPENLVDTTQDPALQALLASLLLEEDEAWSDGAAQIFDDCRRAVARGMLRKRLKELDILEEEARRNGDDAALHRCLRERMELNLKIKKSP
jgi:DNA primase